MWDRVWSPIEELLTTLTFATTKLTATLRGLPEARQTLIDERDRLASALRDAKDLIDSLEAPMMIAAIHGENGTPENRLKNQQRMERIEAALRMLQEIKVCEPMSLLPGRCE